MEVLTDTSKPECNHMGYSSVDVTFQQYASQSILLEVLTDTSKPECDHVGYYSVDVTSQRYESLLQETITLQMKLASKPTVFSFEWGQTCSATSDVLTTALVINYDASWLLFCRICQTMLPPNRLLSTQHSVCMLQKNCSQKSMLVVFDG